MDASRRRRVAVVTRVQENGEQMPSRRHQIFFDLFSVCQETVREDMKNAGPVVWTRWQNRQGRSSRGMNVCRERSALARLFTVCRDHAERGCGT
jgi:hypothetical protein